MGSTLVIMRSEFQAAHVPAPPSHLLDCPRLVHAQLSALTAKAFLAASAASRAVDHSRPAQIFQCLIVSGHWRLRLCRELAGLCYIRQVVVRDFSAGRRRLMIRAPPVEAPVSSSGCLPCLIALMAPARAISM